MNTVILTGRIVRDPDVRHSDGISVAKFTVACNRRFKKEGEQQADFISCVAFGKTAEFVEKYFKKGQKIDLIGRIQTGSYDGKDGTKHYTTDVVVENVEFGETKGKNGDASPTALNDGFANVQEGLDKELPFN